MPKSLSWGDGKSPRFLYNKLKPFETIYRRLARRVSVLRQGDSRCKCSENSKGHCKYCKVCRSSLSTSVEPVIQIYGCHWIRLQILMLNWRRAGRWARSADPSERNTDSAADRRGSYLLSSVEESCRSWVQIPPGPPHFCVGTSA